MTGLALDVRVERGKELAMRLRSHFPTIDGLTVCAKTRKSDESNERRNLRSPLASDFKHQKTGELLQHAPFVDGVLGLKQPLYIDCVLNCQLLSPHHFRRVG